jgi:hypothetical protein
LSQALSQVMKRRQALEFDLMAEAQIVLPTGEGNWRDDGVVSGRCAVHRYDAP